MANFDVSNAKFNREIRKMEVTDPCHADTFNNVFKTLINNDVALNSQYEEFKKEANTIKDTKNNKKYKWGVEDGLIYIEEVED
ncbi:hypothetical protein G8S49_01565 [Clostridium botulinum C]|uniref:Uncharacterized protein n=2 Tax=Clostridium botulinum TaxID=1491 RepID=A0A9Q4TLB8_CLOBO|nr:hypothetical protein [Clostridium botulinum]EGO86969.1 hypothetical protein CBCST_14916 [Clostridium botulinum C str. Stockholm]MCD3194263.1 hypothetical protein [Clostridium botulinum C]MCD3199108.1 hypothetical protein [Clostridium botulinum C]MCD3204583.1 hypothetical protein [Clostridium botulinum C]MCD3207926.1 hypothetical protein [Clostridium botulinum C]